MTPEDLETLLAAGLVELTAQHGERAEYRLTPAGCALLRGREPLPGVRATRANRPEWAYDCVHDEMPREPPLLCVIDGGKS